MKVVITPRAEADIEHQHAWGVERYGAAIANKTFARVRKFIEVSVAHVPRSGRRLPPLDLYEAWIPRTPFVVFYRVDDANECVWILALFHHAQDRTKFEPLGDDE